MDWRRIAIRALLGSLALTGAAAAEDRYQQVRPLLETYCYSCHGPRNQLGGLGLHVYETTAQVRTERAVWNEVYHRVDRGVMPPPGRPQPTEAERAQLLGWLHDTLYRVDCDAPRHPGRVTARRLNRAEYNNTIRDLFRVYLSPADDFPSDEVGYGFDNIGDVLSLPTLLMEKYLAAAEQITGAALVTTDPLGERLRYEAEACEIVNGNAGGGVVMFSSTGEIVIPVVSERAGPWRITVAGWGQQAGPEVCRAGLFLDGQLLAQVAIPATNRRTEAYLVETDLPAGRHELRVRFINDYYQPDAPDPAQRDRNLAMDWVELQGPAQPPVPPPFSHRRIIVASPAESSDAAWTTAASQILAKFGSRVWRRPLQPAEVDRLARYAVLARREGDTFAKGIELALQAMLVSPHFLYRVEPDPEAGVRDLTSWELASRLSYFLWSSMPDERLFELAEQDRLREPKVLAAEAARMLQDPKSTALAENFAAQWLQLRNLEIVQPDPVRFARFDDRLRHAMRGETLRFFQYIVAEDRSVLEFIDSDYAFLNERLAEHYGIAGVRGEQFRQVKLTPAQQRQRGGVLTQASVLTVTSNPTRTSPVKRGKFVMENLLGTPPPEPPANVPPLDESDAAMLTGSLRERMEQHRKDPNCAVCHIEMDAIGFGFENYDAIGGWRTQDGPFAIDPAGELPGGRAFQTPADLRRLLRLDRDGFVRCLTEKLLTYALGRGLEYYDTCVVNDLAASCRAAEYRFGALIEGIVTSDAFRRRAGEESGT